MFFDVILTVFQARAQGQYIKRVIMQTAAACTLEMKIAQCLAFRADYVFLESTVCGVLECTSSVDIHLTPR